MAITQTFLTADLGRNDVVMKVDSGTGFPLIGRIANPGYLVRIDTEYLLAIAQVVDGTIRIAQRGYDGTSAQPHDVNALVMVSALPSDFAPVQPSDTVELPPSSPLQVSIGEDLTISAADILAMGNRTRVFVTLAEVTITLEAPSLAQDGLILIFTTLIDEVATIEAPNLIADGGLQSSAVSDGEIGACLYLMAQNGLWNKITSNNFNIS